MRSYSRNDFGDLDETLIPSAFKNWYLDKESDVSDFENYVEDDEVHTEISDSDETTSYNSLRRIVSLLNLLRSIEVEKIVQKIAIFVGLIILEFTLNGRILSRNYRKSFKKSSIDFS